MQSSVVQGVEVMILSICSKGRGRFKQFVLPRVTFIIILSFLAMKQHLSWKLINSWFLFSYQPAMGGTRMY